MYPRWEGSEGVQLTELLQYRFQLQIHASDNVKFWVSQIWGFSSPKRETVVYFRNDCSIAINRVTVLRSWDGRFRYSTSVQTSRRACNLRHDLHTAIYYSVCRNSLYSTHGRNVTGRRTVSSPQRHAAGDASLDNMKWWTTCRWR